MKRIAVADIGTHSIICLLCEMDRDGSPKVRAQDLFSVRLGEGLRRTGEIGNEPLKRAIRDLHTAKRKAAENGAPLIVIGTWVFRAAGNAESVCRRIEEETGLQVEVLSEEDEALWSFRGMVTGRRFNFPVCACDIGGGSTEVVLGDEKAGILDWVSFSAGAVNLTEEWITSDPPSDEDRIRMESAAKEAVAEHASDLLGKGKELIVCGGTATTLAALVLKMKSYDAGRIDRVKLSFDQVETWFMRLAALPVSERGKTVAIDPRRADILPAGIAILKAVMRAGRFSALRISDRGVRFGIALREGMKIVNQKQGD